MLKTFDFQAFGVQYRTRQFAAVPALAIMNRPETPPQVVLAQTEVLKDGHWTSLDTREAINAHVLDQAGALPPRVVLSGVLRVVGDYSFGFMRDWKSAKVPRRFLSGAASVESVHVDPIITALTTGQGKMATLRELEEYYSLEDAFRMFDSMVVSGINAALSTEAAMANAKR